MSLFYQGKLIEEYSKEELIEMIKELIDQRAIAHPDRVVQGTMTTRKRR